MTFDSEGGIYGEGGFGVPTAPYQQVWSLNLFYSVKKIGFLYKNAIRFMSVVFDDALRPLAVYL